ncbi:homocysteine S-methyltransferase family protein [Rothia endophytica]
MWKLATYFALNTSVWVEAGARLIGGCCRTTPQDIAEISRAVRDLQ